MIKVLMADVNITFANAAMVHFQTAGDIEPYLVHDGFAALDALNEIKPHLLLLDLVLPRIDGLGVLEKLADCQVKPRTILMSTVCNEDVLKKALVLGIDYYIMKPVNLDVLCTRVRQFSLPIRQPKAVVTPEKAEIAARVTEVLINLGIPAHLLGYQYLREAIMVTIERSQMIHSITKGLYPAIAAHFNITVPKVERAMRHAISLTKERGNPLLIDRLFGQNTKFDRTSNSRFIATIADNIRLNVDILGGLDNDKFLLRDKKGPRGGFKR